MKTLMFILVMMGPHGNIITQKFDTAVECDKARTSTLDEARRRNQWVGAVCWERPTSGRFNYR
jgi:hypothetical protein